jgi:hypothetical protein
MPVSTKHMGPENQGYVPPEAKKPLTVGETELEKKWLGEEARENAPEITSEGDANPGETPLEKKWFGEESSETGEEAEQFKKAA